MQLASPHRDLEEEKTGQTGRVGFRIMAFFIVGC